MKNFLIPVLFTLIAFGAQAQKVGYVNSAALMSDLAEVKKADSNLEGFQTQLQKRGEQMVQQLQTKYQELNARQTKGDISPKDLETEAAKLKEEESKIAQFEQDMNKQVMEKRQALYQPILDKVNSAINEVSKEQGYTYVFDSSTGVMLYADAANDLTDAVKKRMANMPAAKAEPAPAANGVPAANTPATAPKSGKKG